MKLPGIVANEESIDQILVEFDQYPSLKSEVISFGIETLLLRYSYIVSEINLIKDIENKYFIDLSGYIYIYDYLNDLMVRNNILSILQHLEYDQNKQIFKRIDRADSGLKQNIIGDCFLLKEKVKEKYPKDKYWWYYGKPSVVSD